MITKFVSGKNENNTKKNDFNQCWGLYSKSEMLRLGFLTCNYHYRILPVTHDIFITLTITGALNFILTVTTLRKKPGIVDKLVVHFLQTFLVKK